jgi:hypothetical protein
MIKEFEIKDILNAVSSISKIERKRRNVVKKDSSAYQSTPVEPIKSKILVLDQMIE